jgi:hypothetical protein
LSNESSHLFVYNEESIVKSLKSDDPNEVSESMIRADQLLGKLKSNDNDGASDIEECEGIRTKIVENRTIINKHTNNSTLEPIKLSADQSQEAFLKTLEADANERYERRTKNKKLSDELKDLGNKEFSNGNFNKAIELYTQVKFDYLNVNIF